MVYEIFPAVDGEWGEVHDYVFHDAVTQAQWELDEFGAKIAMRNIPDLDKLIAKKTWRSAKAADLRLKIIRLAVAEGVPVPIPA